MLAPSVSGRPATSNGSSNAAGQPGGDHIRRLAASRGVEQDDELIAAEPGDDVRGPRAAQQPPGHGDEQLVAGVVAELVVDGLEGVQIEIEGGHLLPMLGRARATASRKLILEVQAVGQAGEVVVQRLVGDLIQQAAVLQRRGRLGADAGEAVEQVPSRRQALGALARPTRPAGRAADRPWPAAASATPARPPRGRSPAALGSPLSASTKIGSGRGSSSIRCSGPPGLGQSSCRRRGRSLPPPPVARTTSSWRSASQRQTPTRSQSITLGTASASRRATSSLVPASASARDRCSSALDWP